MTSEVLTGSVESITFYNPENGYCVMKIAPDDLVLGAAGGFVTVTGPMPEIQPGEHIQLEGAWINDKRYGRQFKAEQVQRTLPVTVKGMKRYLGSGLVRGVGKKTAEKIVDHFGAETLKILDSPDAAKKLRKVRDVGQTRAGAIVESWKEQRAIADVMMHLQQYNIGTALAVKIYKFYQSQDVSPVQIIQSDPYQLSRDIHGVGFKTADRIAQNLGLPMESQTRLQAGLMYALEEATGQGHVCLPGLELVKTALELLENDNAAQLEEALRHLITNGDVRVDDVPDPDNPQTLLQMVYLPPSFYSERGIARRIGYLLDEKKTRITAFKNLSDDAWQNLLEKTAGATALTEQQQGAIRMALTNKLSILTGGPGTGKTTTLKALIAALDQGRHRYLLASPTGRAAKRLNQATDRPARTIHRMLGFSFEGFGFNEENTLDTDFVIIDEASMLDVHLFYALLRALNLETHLLLVGDVDQLPSVGAGDVLRDLIASQVAPVTRLKAIFRQSGGSRIIENAHRINQGELPDMSNESDDFFFFGAEEPAEASDLLVDVVQNRIPRKFGYDPVEDVQVLAPMYRTQIGVDALNTSLQAALNPPGRLAEKRFGSVLFRVGDKVIQTRNDYEKEVFNGDIGRIHSLDFTNQIMQVMIDGRAISYDFTELDQITLAYACSVHRSQGSEYPVVVVPMMTQHFMMLQRNLLYTAVTRAREVVVLIGMRKAVAIAVKNDRVSKRWTALEWLLRRA